MNDEAWPKELAIKTQIKICYCNCLKDENPLLCPNKVECIEQALLESAKTARLKALEEAAKLARRYAILPEDILECEPELCDQIRALAKEAL